jgi:hypothetical protein
MFRRKQKELYEMNQSTVGWLDPNETNDDREHRADGAGCR